MSRARIGCYKSGRGAEWRSFLPLLDADADATQTEMASYCCPATLHDRDGDISANGITHSVEKKHDIRTLEAK